MTGRADHVTFLKLKSAAPDGGEMLFEGWASRGHEDRMGDVVEPAGARYELPLPVLAHHQHDTPVGAIIAASVSAAGIRVRGRLTAGLEEAEKLWKLLRDGALSMSVGFRPVEAVPRPGGGQRFTIWDWYEVSLVSVPACPGTGAVAVGKGMAYSMSAPAAPAPAAPAPLRVSRAALAPQMPGESELERAYRLFDATVDVLPSEVKALCDVRRMAVDGNRFTLTGESGKMLATVDLTTGEVRTAGERRAAPAPAPAPARKLPPAAASRKAVQALAGAVGRAIARSRADLQQRIERLEARLADAEASGFRYRGYWQEGHSTAERGDAFSRDGSLWWCTSRTDQKPSTECTDWVRAVRAGRDAR